MTFDAVLEAVLEDGRREAALIREEARNEKERILSDAQARAESLMQERMQEARTSAGLLRAKERARADIEAKRLVLKAEKEVMDKVFKHTLRRMSQVSYAPRIIQKRSDLLRSSRVYCNEKDREAVVSAIEPLGARLGPAIQCSGGLVIESEDGTVMYDYRLESVLRSVWERSIGEVAALLRDET